MTRGVEGELRALLAARAAAVEPSPDPSGDAARGIRRDRWRRSVTAAVMLGVLAALAVPVALTRPFTDLPLQDWPVRGSLADNGGFVEAARDRAAECVRDHVGPDSVVELDPDAIRMVYAGDNGTVRLAVAAVPRESRMDQGLLLLLGRRAGASADTLNCRVADMYVPGEAPRLAWSWQRTPRRPRTLLALGPPRTRAVDYSPRPSFQADGTWHRNWRELRAPGGAALARMPAAAEPAPAYMARVRFRTPDGDARVQPWRDPLGLPSRGTGLLLTEEQVEGPHTRLRQYLYGTTGVPPGRFTVRTLVDADGTAPGLFTASLPGGATFQVVWSRTRRNSWLVPGWRASRPVAVLVRERDGNSVVVLAPGRAGGQAQLRQDGRTLGTKRLDDAGRAAFPVTDERIWGEDSGRHEYRFRVAGVGDDVVGGRVRESTGGEQPWFDSVSPPRPDEWGTWLRQLHRHITSSSGPGDPR